MYTRDWLDLAAGSMCLYLCFGQRRTSCRPACEAEAATPAVTQAAVVAGLAAKAVHVSTPPAVKPPAADPPSMQPMCMVTWCWAGTLPWSWSVVCVWAHVFKVLPWIKHRGRGHHPCWSTGKANWCQVHMPCNTKQVCRQATLGALPVACWCCATHRPAIRTMSFYSHGQWLYS